MKTKMLNQFWKLFYRIKRIDWISILTAIISIQIGWVFLHFMKLRSKEFVSDNNLQLLLTVNGLFSAIIITYFFQRISWTMERKKDDYQEAVKYSQNITDFRRILQKLTSYYNIWYDDDSTKRLLEHGKYKNIDYYDFKLTSYSNYKPKDAKLIEELKNDTKYNDVSSDTYLGMISLVNNRKTNKWFDDTSELYKYFEKKGIYNYEFIRRCIEIDWASRLSYSFQKDYQIINYNALSKKSRDYILSAAERIDTNYKGKNLDNSLMAEICSDMNEHYFKELFKLLLRLRKGISGINLIVYIILILSMIFGVIIPFITLVAIDSGVLKKSITQATLAINITLLIYFTLNFYRIVKKEITWS